MSSTDTPPLANQRFSDLLHLIREQAHTGGLTMAQLVELVGPKGHVFLTVFLILPFLQPIPLPGISTVVGIIISIAGGFMALGRPVWLPKRFANAHLDGKIALRMCSVFEKIMLRLEKVIRQRGRAIVISFVRFNGGLLCLHGLILSLPLPIPMSNFLPALVLFLIALGTLEEDFALVLLGYAAALVNAAFFVALVLLPYFGIRFLQHA